MTATDPRPALAAALAARLAPAAEALAEAYAEDLNPEPPPPDDRARAECHRAARAQLDHLRRLLALLDWAGAHLPEPEPEEEEFHYLGGVWTGSRNTPGFYAWAELMDRREARRRKREEKKKRERKAKKRALAAQANANGRGDGGEEYRRPAPETGGAAPFRPPCEGGDPSPIPEAAAAGGDRDEPFEASGRPGNGPRLPRPGTGTGSPAFAEAGGGRGDGGASSPMSRNPAPPAEGPAARLHDET